MIADALRAETWRLVRNRAALFWSLFLTPLLFAGGGVLFHWLSKSKGDDMARAAGIVLPPPGPLNLAEALTTGASNAANGVTLVLMLVAAATVYAGDYRWETWRLITARNSRFALILGKVGTMKLMALASTLLFFAAAFVFTLAQAMIYQRGLAFDLSGGEAGRIALAWLLSYIRIVQYGLVALLTAVLTRSLMAALLVPIAVGFVQSILGSPAGQLIGLDPSEWPAQLLLPGLAFDSLKFNLDPGFARLPMDAAPVWPALIGFALWTLVPLALALILFERQDLSKE